MRSLVHIKFWLESLKVEGAGDIYAHDRIIIVRVTNKGCDSVN